MLPLLIATALSFIAAGPALLPFTDEQERQLDKRDGFLRQAQLAQADGDWKMTATWLRHALGLQERVFGDSQLTVVTADLLSEACIQGGDWSGAAAAFRVIARVHGRLLGEGHHKAIDARISERKAAKLAGLPEAGRQRFQKAGRTLADAVRLYQEGRGSEAVKLARDAADAYTELLGADDPSTLSALNNLAMMHQQAGDLTTALPINERVLAARRRLLGTSHPLYAVSLNNLANLHRLMGDDAAALPLMRESLAIRRRVLGDGDPAVTAAMNNLAVILQGVGDGREAIRLLERVAEIHRRRNDRHPDYATALSNLGATLLGEGLRARALPLLEKAAAIHKAELGEKHPRTIESMHNLGGAYRELGDYRQALAVARDVAAAQKRTLGVRHPNYAKALLQLAMVHQDLDDDEASMPLLREALDIQKRALGVRHPDYANTLGRIAQARSEAGESEEAIRLYKQALATLRPGQRMHEAMAYNLATAYLQAGEAGKGLKLMAALPGAAPEQLHGMAIAWQGLGRPGTAVLLAEEAFRRAAGPLERDAAMLSERQQMDALARLRLFGSLRLSLPDEPAAPSYRHALAVKGLVFAAQRQRRVFASLAGDTDAAALLDATRRLAAARRSSEEQERLTREKEAIERRLASRSEAFRVASRPAGINSIRAALPEGAALVDYLEYTHFHPATGGKPPRFVRHVTAWVVRSDKAPVQVPLGPSAPLIEAAAAWRTALEKGEGGEKHAALIRVKAWEPLVKHLGGAKVLLVSPDGPLAGVPFAALPGTNPGTYLLEEAALAIVPAPRLLVSAREKVTGKPSLLAVGGVDFGEKGNWEALPATGPEAELVTRFFKARIGGRVTTLSGAKATVAALREGLPKTRFAHLATHGFGAMPRRNTAKEAALRRVSPLFGAEGVTGWNPSLLSGLVLADAAVLTALEVSEMDLSHMETAVLSACQTGMGREAAGEGLLGLQRAFAVAGCRSVVSSLWSVHDAATGVLMERFYHNLWEKKLPKLEALRQAQLDVMRNPDWVNERSRKLAVGRGVGFATESIVAGRKEKRSPTAWWAAWQLSGEWR